MRYISNNYVILLQVFCIIHRHTEQINVEVSLQNRIGLKNPLTAAWPAGMSKLGTNYCKLLSLEAVLK